MNDMFLRAYKSNFFTWVRVHLRHLRHKVLETDNDLKIQDMIF